MSISGKPYGCLGLNNYLSFTEQKAVLHSGHTHEELKIKYSQVTFPSGPQSPSCLITIMAFYSAIGQDSDSSSYALFGLKMTELEATFDHLVYLFDCIDGESKA